MWIIIFIFVLSEKGEARAAESAFLLEDVGVCAIFV